MTTTLNRPNASETPTPNNIEALCFRVRRLWSTVPLADREMLSHQLMSLEIDLDLLSLRAASVSLQSDDGAGLHRCMEELLQLEQVWSKYHETVEPSGVGK